MTTFNDLPESTNGKAGRRKSDVAIIGAPFDMGSSNHSGQRLAPTVARQVGTWPEGMYVPQYKIDPMEELIVVDAGDVEVLPSDVHGGWEAISDYAGYVYQNTRCLLAIGGDHTISGRVLQGIVSVENAPLTLFHFDAHTDFYRHDPGVEMNHGTWVRWAIEHGLVNRVVQFGVRGWGIPRQDLTWAGKNDVTTYHASQTKWMELLHQELDDTSDPIYLSIDIDVLDPAFAPAVAYQEPGGMSVRELFAAIKAVTQTGHVVGADIVEFIPALDTLGHTAKLVNRCIAQTLTGIACQGA
jgi:agmatinase